MSPMSDDEIASKMARMLADVGAAAERASWTRPPIPEMSDETVRAYLGEGDGWRITVVSFDIEPQGFPKGSRGFDGAAAHAGDGVMIHLTRPLAEKLYKLAEGKTGGARS